MTVENESQGQQSNNDGVDEKQQQQQNTEGTQDQQNQQTQDQNSEGDQSKEEGTFLTKDGEAEGDGKSGDGKGDEGKAPEAYDPFTIPEGYTVDEGLQTEFTATARELNLDQDGAQKLVDYAPKFIDKIQQANADRWNDIRKEWVQELKSDKDLGGQKINETQERAQRALRKFDPTGNLSSFLGSTGFGDNAELVRFLVRVDQATGEDKIVDGDAGNSQRSTADIMYGDSK